MIRLLRLLPSLFARIFRSRRDLLLKGLALRQQLGVLRQKYPRPHLVAPDKFFWMMLRRMWPGWKRALILVQPEPSSVGIVQASGRIGPGSRGVERMWGGGASAENLALDVRWNEFRHDDSGSERSRLYGLRYPISNRSERSTLEGSALHRMRRLIPSIISRGCKIAGPLFELGKGTKSRHRATNS